MSAHAATSGGVELHLGALGAEIAAVMRPLLAPLVEKWEWVTGDGEQVHETAHRWRSMSDAVTEVADCQRASSDRLVGEWEGWAYLAFDDAVDEVVRDLKEVAVRTREVADLLDQAAVAVREAERIVADLIRGLIEWAAVTLVISAAGAVVTLGASAAAGAAAAAARAGVVGARIASELGRLALELRRIQLVLGVYQTWVKSLTFVQRRLVNQGERIVVGDLSGLDASLMGPALDLAEIRVAPERCFEEPGAGPRW
jgi:uncharacterized protein YukE